MTRIVAAYCRTACAGESDPPSGVRRQEEEIRRYAKHRGLAIEASYADAGVSGIKLQRPQLQRLLADCRAIDTVITRDPERLSRDHGQLLALLLMFRNAGVRVEYCEEGRNHGFLETVLCAVAEVEEAKRRSKPKSR